jgi:hypothetical protein
MTAHYEQVVEELGIVIRQYSESFSSKSYGDENDDYDLLMNVFSITPKLKRENRQYWGRELGMCWQLLVTRVFQQCCSDFAPGYRAGADEMCDLMAGHSAIDTKYRIGSGDSGTLKKFKQYGRTLTDQGFTPIILILRSDNLPAAIQACRVGGWRIYTADDSFEYIHHTSGFDLRDFLHTQANRFRINRPPKTP